MQQQELNLPFPELADGQPPLPARMINEYVYCPRLAYLEWVQGEWAESADTVEGSHGHRRVNRESRSLPPSAELEPDDRLHARSVTLSSNSLGLIATLDLVEVSDGKVVPVDYKRGKRPHVERDAYDPERVQLCVQGMLLEEHGYDCDSGVLYYISSRERVNVPFDAELRRLTRHAIEGLRLTAAHGKIPPPLEDSPKCPRCSLVGICLPDEVNYFRGTQPIAVRPLAVAAEEAFPLYVQATGAKVAKSGETLVVSVKDEKVATARLAEVSQLVLFGNVYVTTPTLHELMYREIPVTWHSFGGWFLGHSVGNGHKNAELRAAQYRASFDEQACLRIARGLVVAKIQNARTLLRRNWKGDVAATNVLSGMMRDVRHARRAASISELLGVEGAAASRYFGNLPNLLRSAENPEEGLTFDFAKRNRRPPADPINALLSYAYALLTRTWSVVLGAVGLDPFCGFYHQSRYGRPALALDLMEPFRPLIADSSVLQAVNNGEARPTDFVRAAGAVNLRPDGRKRFIAAFERRLQQKVTHPLFGYRLSYRRLLEVQARLFARFLMGETPDYPNFTTR